MEKKIAEVFALCEITGMEPDDLIALMQVEALNKIAERMK